MLRKIARAAKRHLSVAVIQRVAKWLPDAGAGLEAEAALAARSLHRIAAQMAAQDVPAHDAAFRSALRGALVAQLPPEARELVPALEPRASPVMSTWTFQNEVMEWDIGKDDL